MKPVYVVLLMGAAAVGGGLVVRYSDRPVQIAQARSTPPTVIAPPIPPAAHVGPSNSVPVRSAPPEIAAPPPEKPSALSLPVHIGKPERTSEKSEPAPPVIARIRIPKEPPAVIALERSTVPPPTPVPAPAAPAPVPAPREIATLSQTLPPPALTRQAEPNRVTLKPGTVISVRIAEALSSDRNVRGDIFSGTLDRPLVADGFVIAERGARVRGEVVTSSHAAPADGMAELILQLREVSTSDGQRVHIVTQPWRKQGTFSTADDTTGVTSTSDSMVTRHPANIKPATSIPFRVEQPVEITERR